MKTYICNRCGHDCQQKSNLIYHLTKKKPCEPLVRDVDRSEQLKEFEPKPKEAFCCSLCAGRWAKEDHGSKNALIKHILENHTMRESQALLRSLGHLPKPERKSVPIAKYDAVKAELEKAQQRIRELETMLANKEQKVIISEPEPIIENETVEQKAYGFSDVFYKQRKNESLLTLICDAEQIKEFLTEGSDGISAALKHTTTDPRGRNVRYNKGQWEATEDGQEWFDICVAYEDDESDDEEYLYDDIYSYTFNAVVAPMIDYLLTHKNEFGKSTHKFWSQFYNDNEGDIEFVESALKDEIDIRIIQKILQY